MWTVILVLGYEGGDEMTLREYFEKLILPSMAERQDAAEIYEESYEAVVNAILADCFEIENAIRRQRGQEELPAVKYYLADEELPYDLALMENCMNYGAAARLLVDEAGDEGPVVGYLDSLYREGKSRYLTGEYAEMEQVW